MASPRDAAILKRFYKTGPGTYGEHERFLGIRVPRLRRLARDCRGVSWKTLAGLLASPFHEVRQLACLILTDRFSGGDARIRRRVVGFCLRHRAGINNWDLVDLTAPAILGSWVLDRRRSLLYRLARSERLWDRRMAVVATLTLIRAGQLDDALRLAESMLTESEPLLHKAAGWMLREVGKRDEPLLRRFLNRHAAAMPRIMLSYAVERLPAADRARYRAAGRIVNRAASMRSRERRV